MDFSEQEKAAVYKAINCRRDVRKGFLNKSIEEDVLQRILEAAHAAPSVGFMQPWNFILIKDSETREKIKANFEESKSTEAALFKDEQKELYNSLKLEGIVESPLNICITCDRTRHGESGLGRSLQPEMDLYSTVCAVQNLWLAARAEGVGIGWVSILDRNFLKELLNIPQHIEIVAYLCAGYVEKFAEVPDLESEGWQERLELEKLIFQEKWDNA